MSKNVRKENTNKFTKCPCDSFHERLTEGQICVRFDRKEHMDSKFNYLTVGAFKTLATGTFVQPENSEMIVTLNSLPVDRSAWTVTKQCALTKHQGLAFIIVDKACISTGTILEAQAKDDDDKVKKAKAHLKDQMAGKVVFPFL